MRIFGYRITFKTAIYAIIIIIVPILLWFIEWNRGQMSLTIVMLGILLSMIGGQLIELRLVPRPFRNMRRQVERLESIAAKHPMLNRRYQQFVKEIGTQLGEMSGGRFSFLVSQVPDLSVYAMEIVDKRCVLTFPLSKSEALLTPNSGPAHRYYEAMVKSSQRMKNNKLDGIVRIFILQASDQISQNLFEFIQRNISDEITIRFVLAEDMPRQPNMIESIDFGIYETLDEKSWVMVLRDPGIGGSFVDYIVETNPDKVDLYDKYTSEILRRSKGYTDFMKQVLAPINGHLWETYFPEKGYEMFPPHGLSDEDADFIVESALKKVEDPKHAAVLVLGFTPKLINKLSDRGVGKIISYDQVPAKPDYSSRKSVSFITGNWLDMDLDEKFDAVVFDESLNNLTRLQLGLFFPKISKILKPHGYLVGRMMGRFDEEKAIAYEKKSAREAINMLRRVQGSCHEDYAPQIICLLHSRLIAFDLNVITVDCERWNNALFALRREDFIDDSEYRIWRLQFNFKLLSPDIDSITRTARMSNIALSGLYPAKGTYVGLCEDTQGFFKLFVFEYIDK